MLLRNNLLHDKIKTSLNQKQSLGNLLKKQFRSKKSVYYGSVLLEKFWNWKFLLFLFKHNRLFLNSYTRFKIFSFQTHCGRAHQLAFCKNVYVESGNLLLLSSCYYLLSRSWPITCYFFLGTTLFVSCLGFRLIAFKWKNT